MQKVLLYKPATPAVFTDNLVFTLVQSQASEQEISSIVQNTLATNKTISALVRERYGALPGSADYNVRGQGTDAQMLQMLLSSYLSSHLQEANASQEFMQAFDEIYQNACEHNDLEGLFRPSSVTFSKNVPFLAVTIANYSQTFPSLEGIMPSTQGKSKEIHGMQQQRPGGNGLMLAGFFSHAFTLENAPSVYDNFYNVRVTIGLRVDEPLPRSCFDVTFVDSTKTPPPVQKYSYARSQHKSL